MKNLNISLIFFLCVAFVFSGCALNKTKKGAAVGAVSGGAGALIGNKMDKQAAELEKTVPDAKVERVGEGIVVEFSSDVLFGFDQSDLSYQSKGSLDKLVKVLNIYPDTDIEVQGHTDSKGSEAYNQTLSEKRAGTVSNYLKNQGIAYSRVGIRGYGETAPKYSNSSSSGRDQNRRVEFLITANAKMRADAEREAAN